MQIRTEIEYTPEQVENRTSDYIYDNCGRYFKPIPSDTILTYYLSKCGLCNGKSIADGGALMHYRIIKTQM